MEIQPTRAGARRGAASAWLLLFLTAAALPALASSGHVSEANLVLPDLRDTSLVAFFGTMSGWTLLS